MAHDIICIVCGHVVPSSVPLLQQIDDLEEHLAAEHGVDLTLND